MELNNTNQTGNPPLSPAQTPILTEHPVHNKRSFFSIILGVLVLLAAVGGGAYYVGTQNNSVSNNSQSADPQITSETNDFAQNSGAVNPTTNTLPTTPPSPSGSSSEPVTVPSDWKSFTATDLDLGVKTTMSMPPGYSFRFTGSEFTIQNDSDATELWDYSSSVYRDNDEVLKNHYDGSSRRTWYEKYLSEKQSMDKIVSVKEKPLNSSTYLEITIQIPSYDDHGVTSGTKNGMHYVYVQNNILHMIRPASNKAYTQAAQIPLHIGSILASLTSVQTK